MKKSIIAAILTVTVVILIILCVVVGKMLHNDNPPIDDNPPVDDNPKPPDDSNKPAPPLYKYPTWSEEEITYNKTLFSGLDGTLISTLKSPSNKYNTPLEKLTSYSYEALLSSWTGAVFVCPKIPSRQLTTAKPLDTNLSRVRCIHNLYDFNDYFPLQQLKIIDDHHVLAIYRMIDNDGVDLYVYFVFKKTVEYKDVSEYCPTAGNYESWDCYGEYYFARKANSHEQFAHLKVGDTLTDLETSDLALIVSEDSYLYNFYVGQKNNTFWYMMEDVCLLKEGVLRILLMSDVPRTGGDIWDVRGRLSKYRKIAEIEFYPYGTEAPEGFTISILPDASLIELP